MKKNAKSICASYFFNNNWWTNGPDFLVVRGKETASLVEPLYRTWWFPREEDFGELFDFYQKRHDQLATISYSEAKTYASLVLMLGGALVSGDRISHLNDKGLELLQKVLTAETAPGRPLNLCQDPLSKIWVQKLASGRTRIGLFNWEDESQTVKMDLKELGVEGSNTARDFWTGEQVSIPANSEFDLHPRSSQVLEF